MRKFYILGLTILLFCGCSGQVKSHSAQELLDHYLTYQRNKDLEGIMSLFYKKDTPPYVLDAVRRSAKKNLEFTITSAEIAEIPAEKRSNIMAGYSYNGKILVPNLEPIKQIVLKYDQAGQAKDHQASGSSIMFGKEGEFYYLILSKEKPEKPLVVKIK